MRILAMLQEKVYRTVNIIHYCSSKSKPVCKSVLAAALSDFIDGLLCPIHNYSYIAGRVGKKYRLTPSTDSLSPYGLRITLAHTTKRKLQNDFSVIREAYERREIFDIVWIEGNNNSADGLTKMEKKSGALMNIVETKQFLPTAESWIEKDEKEVLASSGDDNS